MRRSDRRTYMGAWGGLSRRQRRQRPIAEPRQRLAQNRIAPPQRGARPTEQDRSCSDFSLRKTFAEALRDVDLASMPRGQLL